jgi:hypothetical protein
MSSAVPGKRYALLKADHPPQYLTPMATSFIGQIDFWTGAGIPALPPVPRHLSRGQLLAAQVVHPFHGRTQVGHLGYPGGQGVFDLLLGAMLLKRFSSSGMA